MKKLFPHKSHPVSIVIINRILIVSVVVLAIVSGYFQAKLTNEISRYKWLEKKYFQLELKYDKVLENSATTENRTQ